jgi:hypothetical protein
MVAFYLLLSYGDILNPVKYPLIVELIYQRLQKYIFHYRTSITFSVKIQDFWLKFNFTANEFDNSKSSSITSSSIMLSKVIHDFIRCQTRTPYQFLKWRWLRMVTKLYYAFPATYDHALILSEKYLIYSFLEI